jgi:hypothetical protein
MTFPKTFDEFAEEYKIVDSKEVYTNGTELIPIFRVKQWLDHQAHQASKGLYDEEIAKIKKAIEMIDEYLQEPNSIAEDWVMVLKLCLRLLREKVDG